tara:strand:+ start:7535 stop:7813 length:279 start_codon:yes stop_codon:yes gene_type:complete
MANDNGWGGKREGAGRPTHGEVINVRMLLDEAIDPAMVTEMLKQRIESGDQRAIELYLKYRAGVPTQTVDLNVSGEQDINVTLKGLISFDDD